MKEAIRAINERIEIKLQLFRCVESAVPNLDNASDEFKSRHYIIIKDLKSDVAELKRLKEKIIAEQHAPQGNLP